MIGPLVVEVTRNGFVESLHHGTVVVLDPSGLVVDAWGDVAAPMFPRSSLKPLQALALLAAGWSPPDDACLALAAASHSGEPKHLEVVRRILAAAGLDESALDNTPDPDHLRQNCSGKHAAMVATCVAADWPTQGYRDPDHPLQVAIRATVEGLCGEPVAKVAVDGCGAPLFAVSLAGLARGFARVLGSPVAKAMRAHPDLVGGTGRDVTGLMEAVPGLVAKDGAEGVYAAVTADGGAVAVKVYDGAARARLPLLLHGLARLGVDVEPLRSLVPPVLGHGEPVGVVRVAANLSIAVD
ncbi:MAG: asparaginase [Frankiaceae bacterium]|nr:asparaginase [Frankiaceae bacterium]MBV9369568.1 asparaginase [Frankiales bacterium]